MADNKNGYITTGEKLRSFLGYAFVISILIHLLAGPLLPRFAQHHEDTTVEKVSEVKKIKVKVPTPPPPSPTPPPTPTPPPQRTPPPTKTQPQPKPLKVNVPKTTSNSASGRSQPAYVAPKNGSESGVPGGTGKSESTAPPSTAAPGPAVTAKPQCATPYQDATAPNPVTPEYPEQAKEAGLGEVTVLVKVTVGPNGQLQGDPQILQSSSNMAIDRAALSAARQTTYQPKIVDCQPTTGSYTFRATFDPNS